MLLNESAIVLFLMRDILTNADSRLLINNRAYSGLLGHRLVLMARVAEQARSVYESTFNYIGVDLRGSHPYVEMKKLFSKDFSLPVVIGENAQIALERILDPAIEFSKQEKLLSQDPEELDWQWAPGLKSMASGDRNALKAEFMKNFNEYRKTAESRASYISRIAMLEHETGFTNLREQFENQIDAVKIEQILLEICCKKFE